MGSVVGKLVFQPPVPSYSHSDNCNFWLFTRLGERIPAFYIDRGADITVLFSHGNAEDLNMMYGWLHELSIELNVNMLGYDYTGYGLSSGIRPSEEACYADGEAAIDYLTDVLAIPHDRIVLFGRSLGSGVTCYLAERASLAGTPPRGVILECPLLSIYRVAFNLRFTMPGDQFPNVDRAPNVDCPVTVIHGMRDEVVPFWHGQQLYLSFPRQHRCRALWVEEAGHNDIEAVCARNGNALVRHLVAFLNNDLKRPSPFTGSGRAPPLTMRPGQTKAAPEGALDASVARRLADSLGIDAADLPPPQPVRSPEPALSLGGPPPESHSKDKPVSASNTSPLPDEEEEGDGEAAGADEAETTAEPATGE